MDTIEPFLVRSCSILALSAGEKAYSLIELRDKLVKASTSSIYTHFWNQRLQNPWLSSDYHNDFGRWADESLHDIYLAERLSVIEPTLYTSLDDVKDAVVEVVERRLEEIEGAGWIKGYKPFHFMNSKLMVFDTPYKIHQPAELLATLSLMSPASFFYHFIDSKIRTKNGKDDFSEWLLNFGDTYTPLIAELRSIDAYFLSLQELKNIVINKVKKYF